MKSKAEILNIPTLRNAWVGSHINHIAAFIGTDKYVGYTFKAE